MSDRLWALSAYFNPMGFSTRYINYQIFRSRLSIPLATAELSFNGKYELQPQDADLLIQVDNGDLMWQKERLVNKLVKSLPDSCEFVLIIDADAIFSDLNWASRLMEALQRYTFVQPFTRSHRLLPYRLSPKKIDIALCAPRMGFTHPNISPSIAETGIAWAMRRDMLQEHGLYDAAIVGGADRLIIYAILGIKEEAASWVSMNADWSAHYYEWAQRFYKATANKLGSIDGDIFTLWHGNLGNRQYNKRHESLVGYHYNPELDVTLNSDDTWQWNSDKPELHKFVSDYFRLRHEDGRILKARKKQGDASLYLEV